MVRFISTIGGFCMAAIIKRSGGYAVVYSYTDKTGKGKQKWEQFSSREEAERRKLTVELAQKNGTFIVPDNITVGEYIKNFIDYRAQKRKWAPSTYSGNLSYLKNHINPHIGMIPLQKLRMLDIENLYVTLMNTQKGQYKEGEYQEWTERTKKTAAYLSSTTICEVHTLLNSAMKQAVRWKLIAENPVPDEGPKRDTVERKIWDDETMFQALECMKDPFVHLAVHCAYMGSLREGEAMGILLQNINLDYQGMGCITIDRTLQRVSKQSLNAVGRKDILFEFPNYLERSKSVLVLKKPKTETSRRIIFLTEPLRQEIIKRIAQIERDKKKYGSRYHDYGLLFCQENGLPIEPSLCRKRFDRWRAQQNDAFPPMVFHGIRHSSSTYKLQLSEGDIKSVQGDTGHKRAQILLDTYAHTQEKARIHLTRRVERDFYRSANHGQNSPEFSRNALTQLLRSALRSNPQMQQMLLDALLAPDAPDA